MRCNVARWGGVCNQPLSSNPKMDALQTVQYPAVTPHDHCSAFGHLPSSSKCQLVHSICYPQTALRMDTNVQLGNVCSPSRYCQCLSVQPPFPSPFFCTIVSGIPELPQMQANAQGMQCNTTPPSVAPHDGPPNLQRAPRQLQNSPGSDIVGTVCPLAGHWSLHPLFTLCC